MRRLSHFVQRQLVIDIVSTKGQRVMYKLSYLSHWFSVDVRNKQNEDIERALKSYEKSIHERRLQDKSCSIEHPKITRLVHDTTMANPWRPSKYFIVEYRRISLHIMLPSPIKRDPQGTVLGLRVHNILELYAAESQGCRSPKTRLRRGVC